MNIIRAITDDSFEMYSRASTSHEAVRLSDLQHRRRIYANLSIKTFEFEAIRSGFDSRNLSI